MSSQTSTRPNSKYTFPGGTRKYPQGSWNSTNYRKIKSRPSDTRPNGSR